MRDAAFSFVTHFAAPGSGEPIRYAEQWMVEQVRPEVLQTLEVADTLAAADVGLALVRFSLGADIFRKTIWLRKVPAGWLPSWRQYFTRYDDEYESLADDQQRMVDALLEKAEEWQKESAKRPWLW